MSNFKNGDRVWITNPDYGDDCGPIGELEIDEYGCMVVQFGDGHALGVGDTDIELIAD